MFGKNEIVGAKYFKDASEDSLLVTSMFVTLQGEGPFRGRPAFFVRLSKCNLACSFCFVGNTMVQMGNGSSKKISSIKEGDVVVSWKDGVWSKNKVTKTFVSEKNEILKLSFHQNKPIFCTKEHPFYVKDRGWVKAIDINEDDIMIHFSVSERMKMFNPMHDEVVRKKSSKARKGRPGYLNVAWANSAFKTNNIKRMTEKNPEVAIKGFLNRKDRGKKSSLEMLFDTIIVDLPIKYVGDGSLIVDNLAPDYVIEGQKKLIEVWHSDQTEHYGRDQGWMQKRRSRFEKEGYDVLFLPFSEKDDQDSIKLKCSNYVNNGYKLLKKELIYCSNEAKTSNGKAWTRLTGKKDNALKVYNIEVENDHTYIANGLLVHNCDTYFDSGNYLTFDDINVEIDEVIDECYQSKNIERPDYTYFGQNNGNTNLSTRGKPKRKMVLVITGGEPMLQKNISEFLSEQELFFENTQIESNGIVFQDLPESTILVVSPKCSEKNGRAIKYLRPNPKVLERANCLKFVMEGKENSPYSDIPDWAHEWAKDTGRDIYISPMNIYNKEPQNAKNLRSLKNDISIKERSSIDEVISFWEPGLLDMEQNQINHEYAAEFCVNHGYILNLQIHLYAGLA